VRFIVGAQEKPNAKILKAGINDAGIPYLLLSN